MKRDGILFLCVANSARSQMAEGLARAMAPAGTEIASAGSRPASLDPRAVRALAELGIDIGHHRSKGIDEIDLDRVATVITLCAEQVCPVVAGDVEVIAWPLPDPAAASGGDSDVLDAFRGARDAIARRLSDRFGWRMPT